MSHPVQEAGVRLDPEAIALVEKAMARESLAPHFGIEWLPVGQLLMDSAKRNDKRVAYIKVGVPNDWVVNLQGHPDLLDQFLLVRVPRECIEALKKDKESEQDPGTA